MVTTIIVYGRRMKKRDFLYFFRQQELRREKTPLFVGSSRYCHHPLFVFCSWVFLLRSFCVERNLSLTEKVLENAERKQTQI